MAMQNDHTIANVERIMHSTGYGLTETSPLVTMDSYPANLGSVGQLLSNTTVKIVGKFGNVLGAKQDGEIYIRGPQVMSGCLGNPEATASSFQEGWLRSGDVGHFDENGYLYITDRLKEFIKYKAYQVAPAELEAQLVTHPAVQEAAVIGIPDEDAGEIPRAFVVLNTDLESDIKPSDIVNFINDKVSPQKKIRGGVKFVDKIPKSPSGKILRRLLGETFN